MQEIYEILLKSNISKDNIILDEPMSKHTSFKTGGNAKYFIKVYSIDEIKIILNIVNTYDIPLFVLGNGTNILVKDEGFERNSNANKNGLYKNRKWGSNCR